MTMTPDRRNPPGVQLQTAMVRNYIARAAAFLGISTDTLMGRNRSPLVSYPRFAVMLRLKERGMSYPQIGAVFGMDHTSIIHGVRRACLMLRESDEFADLYWALDRSVGDVPAPLSIARKPQFWTLSVSDEMLADWRARVAA